MQIVPTLQSGGVERGTIDIAKSLQREGFEPIVVSSGGIMVYQLKEAGIRHYELNVKTKNPLTIFCNINKLARLMRENHVDIVHVRSRAPMISAFYACKKVGAKLVSTVHGSYSTDLFGWKNFPPKIAYNSMMLKADRIIAVSDFIREHLLQNYTEHTEFDFADKITVIKRGADLNYFNAEKVSKSRIIDLSTKWAIPEDKKIILFPARFTAWKGHEFLIDALAKVRNDFFCLMVGSDHGHEGFRRKVEARIVKSGLSGKVKVVGICKDMPAAYVISHLVVSASLRPEAFGRIAIESQSASRVIVATNVGGSLETVIDGKTGFLVNVDDDDAMAKSIDKVLEMSKAEVDEMGAKARKNIEDHFSNEAMCAKTIAVYKSLLSHQ